MSTKTAAVGLKNMHYAKLIKDDETGVEYSTPKRLAPAITANITPTVNSATLFADDGPLLTANALGEITVEIGITDLPFDIQADLLGLKKNSDGVLVDNADDQAPEVALGFERKTATGAVRYVWLLKGRFKLPTEEAKTAAGTPEFQTPTISGTFLKRIYDGNWRYRVDSGETGVKPETISNWFKKVYSETPTP
ncbi:phage tail protein [Paenibacillus alvei]|uniref:Phage tail protein n=1 Tax=Paenibacillus alvei TaxID=44250 RepID=A0ABT4H7Q4_PAEAL|nr:major tail protein [Paenibacillus alvei]MCY9539174.1 phage tail protein [Paenibacillus alvei]MCY9705907.1 phage tail protein [Paenibacillus alvei]MCY9737962.1 phage tail protein [Paenibacillus alvei]MCY9758703.1 phage tail protein [Paenibacillus alvei]MCY9765015.1 phage tail protein [Paenibacillus alvei]